MDRREAKRRAYFHASLALESVMNDWELVAPEGAEPYTVTDVERIEHGLWEIIHALFERSRP